MFFYRNCGKPEQMIRSPSRDPGPWRRGVRDPSPPGVLPAEPSESEEGLSDEELMKTLQELQELLAEMLQELQSERHETIQELEVREEPRDEPRGKPWRYHPPAFGGWARRRGTALLAAIVIGLGAFAGSFSGWADGEGRPAVAMAQEETTWSIQEDPAESIDTLESKESESIAPETVEPGISVLETTAWEALDPKAETSETETSETEISGTEALEAETSEAEISEPEMSETETSGAERSGTETSKAENSETAALETVDPEILETDALDPESMGENGPESEASETEAQGNEESESSAMETPRNGASETEESGAETSGAEASGAETSEAETSEAETSGAEASEADIWQELSGCPEDFAAWLSALPSLEWTGDTWGRDSSIGEDLGLSATFIYEEPEAPAAPEASIDAAAPELPAGRKLMAAHSVVGAPVTVYVPPDDVIWDYLYGSYLSAETGKIEGQATRPYTVTTAAGTFTAYCAQPPASAPRGDRTVARLTNDVMKAIMLIQECPGLSDLCNTIFYGKYCATPQLRYAFAHALVGFVYEGHTQGLSEADVLWARWAVDCVRAWLGMSPLYAATGKTVSTALLEQMEYADAFIAYSPNDSQDMVWVEWETPVHRKGSLSLKKQSALTHEGLAGAVFLLEQWSEKAGAYVRLTELLTGENGEASAVLTYSKDNQGLFRLTETRAPAGYVMESWQRTFTLDADGAVLSYTVENQPMPGSILVRKTSPDGTALPGVGMALYTTQVLSGAKTLAADGLTYYLLQEGETGSNGTVTFSGLDAVHGYRYLLVETHAAPGYELPVGWIYVGTLPVEMDRLPDEYTGTSREENGIYYLYDVQEHLVDPPVYTLPMTGEAGVTMWMLLAFAGAGAAGAFLRRRR